MASSKPTKKAPEPVEWDLSEPFGILPEGLSLTHNLGCVRSPSAKKAPKPGESDVLNSKK